MLHTFVRYNCTLLYLLLENITFISLIVSIKLSLYLQLYNICISLVCAVLCLTYNLRSRYMYRYVFLYNQASQITTIVESTIYCLPCKELSELYLRFRNVRLDTNIMNWPDWRIMLDNYPSLIFGYLSRWWRFNIEDKKVMIMIHISCIFVIITIELNVQNMLVYE